MRPPDVYKTVFNYLIRGQVIYTVRYTIVSTVPPDINLSGRENKYKHLIYKHIYWPFCANKWTPLTSSINNFTYSSPLDNSIKDQV